MKTLLLFFLAFIFTMQLSAQPATITYQSVLTDDEGRTLTGNRNITFTINNSITNGKNFWTETHNNVSISKGLFEVELGSVNPFGCLDFSQERWLEIIVNGVTLNPRIAFNATSYSMHGELSSNLAGGEAGSIPYQSGENTTAMLAAGSIDHVLTLSGGIPSCNTTSFPVTSVAGKTGVVTLNKGDVELGNVDNTADANKPISAATQTALNGKVDKEIGKGLSTKDYTSAEKTKLAGIAENTNN